jgi:intracellular multiplication protein IcmJ
MKNIYLSASKKNWAVPINHGSNLDKKMRSTRSKILKRDKYICYYCDFRSKHYQEVHHLDGDHSNMSEKNLVTVCPLCHQNHHLLNASITGGGKIIYLPEITQIELNHLCRTIFILFKEEKMYEEMAAAAKATFSSLESRAHLIENDFAIGASDPGKFAQALLKANDENKKISIESLKKFKMLPYYARFEPAIDYWSKTVYKDIPIVKWSELVPDGFNPEAIFGGEEIEEEV